MSLAIRIDFKTMGWCLYSLRDQQPIGKTYRDFKRAYWAKQTLERTCES